LGKGVLLQTQAVPPALQLGVVPLQATQLAPQCPAVLHCRQLVPLHQNPPSQSSLPSQATQDPATHAGVGAAQSTQASPQWSGSVRPQLSQVPALHHS